jgi:hypothetical protein
MLKKILSTGLQGPQRSALDAARARHIVWGGSCMRGRMDAVGEIPEIYFTSDGESGLHEAPSSRPSLPAILNARGSDGTLIFSSGAIPGLCKKIITLLRRQNGTYFIVDPTRIREVPRALQWIVESNIETLNVTSSASEPDSDVTRKSMAFVDSVIAYSQIHAFRGVELWTLR